MLYGCRYIYVLGKQLIPTMGLNKRTRFHADIPPVVTTSWLAFEGFETDKNVKSAAYPTNITKVVGAY